MKRLFLMLVTAALAAACSPNSAPTVDTSAEEAAIRQLLADADAGFAAQDFDKAMTLYADDAVLFAPGAPLIQGTDGIRAALMGAFSDPSMSISIVPTKIDVAQSGDLAYGYGTGVTTMTDPETGKKMTENSKWVTVFKKQPDGSWQAVADMFDSDGPPTPAE